MYLLYLVPCNITTIYGFVHHFALLYFSIRLLTAFLILYLTNRLTNLILPLTHNFTILTTLE